MSPPVADFLGFQWDNLLLECGLLAAFLPARRPAVSMHFLFRALLFKLYFESGIAKWQSPLHDWQDGSAMTFYYETAPLPTALAWYAHHLPRWWHQFESRATLVLELGVPFAAFRPAPRAPGRRGAADAVPDREHGNGQLRVLLPFVGDVAPVPSRRWRCPLVACVGRAPFGPGRRDSFADAFHSR